MVVFLHLAFFFFRYNEREQDLFVHVYVFAIHQTVHEKWKWLSVT